MAAVNVSFDNLTPPLYHLDAFFGAVDSSKSCWARGGGVSDKQGRPETEPDAADFDSIVEEHSGFVYNLGLPDDGHP